MAPFFTIVIANYNHGEFLPEAIESILTQTCTDFELIVVDGGSTDSSLDVIEKYKKHFSWAVSEKDSGQSNAFNKGFSKAKGQFFLWLNADDILLQHTLQKAKDFLSLNKSCKWLAGNTVTMDSNKKIQWCIRGPIFVKSLVRYGTVYVYGPTSFFHRNLFESAGGFDESLHYTMDTDLWFRFINLGYKFKRLNHYCWALRIHKASKTSHAFFGHSNEKFSLEKIRIQRKNNHYDNKFVNLLQTLLKVCTGIFLKRYLDNKRFSGKYIYENYELFG